MDVSVEDTVSGSWNSDATAKTDDIEERRVLINRNTVAVFATALVITTMAAGPLAAIASIAVAPPAIAVAAIPAGVLAA